ncbi:hypothetical protein [Thermanaeromonas sp. C210]|uniref:hypothetical protein n=1 Tax=Thermanaeromonas sp. C210 TaxID=2731925 RepID=UPI00155BCB32|nr:hypothetical protein [Thermanaeromonas sp. C210]GFN22163.1 hypothetical protein TAMC210_04790 [Thermanaeromonas sp. C210]
MPERVRLGLVTLRNEHEVLKPVDLPGIYIVKHYSKRQSFEDVVQASNVQKLYEAVRGRVITIDGVLDEVERGAIKGLRLTSYTSWKKRYEIENILIVLCALGLATAEKQGRGFAFWVHQKEAAATKQR